MKNTIGLICLFLSICLAESESQSLEQLAPTPPLGWNSLNKFGCNVRDDPRGRPTPKPKIELNQ